MKNKVVSLFGNDDQNEKYSGLLNDFIKPFEQIFPKDMDREDIVEFSLNAWNFGNMRYVLPKEDFNRILSSSAIHGPETDLFKKMIDTKVNKFKEYNLFIGDFKLDEIEGSLELTVRTEQKEEFLDKLMNDTDRLTTESDFEQGYVKRSAIVIKPLKPYFDWVASIDIDYMKIEDNEVNIYLVNEEIDDLENWLRKNFDSFFDLELENEFPNRNKWPTKRNFKMFKRWFKVEISTMVYDLENSPVYKED